MARNPEAVAGMKDAGWEIASHGLKWIDYRDVDAEIERRHIREAVELHTQVTGTPPHGFYQGRSSEQTIPLATAEGSFLYFADSYADELPYWIEAHGRHELVVPYTLDANDMRFATPQGFNSGDQFFAYLKDSFDTLYAEGADSPKMMSIGLHCRLVGRPGRAAALARFLDYVQSHERVWVARRIDIARHWIKTHPPEGGHKPSRMALPLFLELYGDIFEHTPQIAERAFRAGLTSGEDTAGGLHAALVKAMRAMDKGEKLKLIRAHPDLAGRLAVAKQLTADSTKEQSSAGLDKLTPGELKRFTEINDAYRSKFSFPFIMAVKGATKEQILAGFEQRIGNTVEAETETALSQIERIAALRLADRLPQ